MQSSEDYITQHFKPRPSQKGATENTDAYNCRIYWIKNDYPTYNAVAEHFGFTVGRVRNYANKYNWKHIREQYEELLEKEALLEHKKRQKSMEVKIDKSNEITFNYLNKRREQLLYLLDELPNNPAPKKLSFDEERELRKELKEINEQLMKLQPLLRTNLHLTNNYTDKQIIENSTKHSGDLNISHFHNKSTLEALKENESEIAEFIRRTANRED